MKLLAISIIILALAVIMTMTGRGGGNFYVLTIALAGVPMHQAAATGQFILFFTSFAATLLFHKYKTVSLPLALFLGGLTAVSAFGGGYLAHLFNDITLKFIFSFMLVVAGGLMLLPVREIPSDSCSRPGFWMLRVGEDVYPVNLWAAVPIAILTGFFAGMVGVSGGSFLVPLMVLGFRIPIRLAMGTSSLMVAAIALMGFSGHFLHGGFNPSWAFPLAFTAVIGGIIGGKIALKSKPSFLKTLFAVTTLIAAVIMVFNALLSK